MQCVDCKKEKERKVKHTVTNSATPPLVPPVPTALRGRVGNSMFDFALFFLLAASTLQIDESRMTNPAMPHQSSSAGGLGLCAQNRSGSSASNASDEDKDDHKSSSLMFGLSLVNA